MPRLDGDFLFCWTAITAATPFKVCSLARLSAASCEKSRGRFAAVRLQTSAAQANTLGMPRRQRQREQQLVFDQSHHIQFGVRLNRVGRFRVIHLVGLLARDYQQERASELDRVMQVLQAALTLQFQRAVNAQVKPGTITLVAITAQRVMQAPLILNQHVRQSLRLAIGSSPATSCSERANSRLSMTPAADISPK